MKSRPIQPRPHPFESDISPDPEEPRRQAPLPDLDAIDRIALMAIARAGVGYVRRPRTVTLHQVIRFRALALVETLGELDGDVSVRVTARGLKAIAASHPGLAR